MHVDPAGANPYPGPVRVMICEKLAAVEWEQLPRYLDIPRHEYAGVRTLEAINIVWDWLAARGRLLDLRPAIVDLGWVDIVTALDGGLAAHRQRERAVAVPPTQRGFNSVNFDLRPLRRPLLAARYEPAALLVFGIPHYDASVGDKLIDWLEECYHPLSRKSNLSLGELVSTVDSVVNRVLRHQHELRTNDVARHIDASRASAEALATLVDRLTDRLGQHQHRLVLLVTVGPEVATPPAVRRLPRPLLGRQEIEEWAMDVLDQAKRDVGVPEPWSVWADLICAHGAEEGDALDPRRVFEFMDESILDLQFEPESFVDSLREASGHA